MRNQSKTRKKARAEEHPRGSGIKIYKRVNKSQRQAFGTSFRVVIPARMTKEGPLTRQFKSKPEALEFAESQFSGWDQRGASHFTLSTSQHHDATEALRLLEGTGLTLVEVAKFAKPRMRPEGGAKTVQEIIEEMLTKKTAQHERGVYREQSLLDFKNRSSRFARDFGHRLAHEVTASELLCWLEELRSSASGEPLAGRSRLNYLRTVVEIFKFAHEEKYIGDNPTSHITRSQRKTLTAKSDKHSGEPPILTPLQARRLITKAHETDKEEGLLAAVTLGLFCGLRTEELKRLSWGDVHLDDPKPFVSVTAAVAKKRARRNVEIPENALEWLTLCNDREGRITANNYSSHYRKRFLKLATAVGFAKKDERSGKSFSAWETNAMRHSFGSYHFALHGDSIKTSEQMGHRQGDEVLFTHYRALARKETAVEFFAIKPEASTKRVVKFAAS